ncbi:MAG: hypothetical protein KBD76_12935 [Bacteriovorax sp.]|jgi:hypothetical protein|nr:hypothetical protein [Bacteriovorax sp.]
MKKILTMISVSLFSFRTFSCADLNGTYGDFIVKVQLNQTGCEKITQSNSDWYTILGSKTEYFLNGKEYLDSNFKTANDSYAFQKAEIDQEKMIVTFRRGNPNVKGNTFLKIYSKNLSGSLVIKSYEVKGENKILKDKWELKKK